MQIINLASIKKVPWKNGGGLAQELFRFPLGSEADFLQRISIADVESSGPFSLYPGYHRILIILRGEGVLIKEPHLETTLKPLEIVFHFRGASQIQCDLLGGSVQDFNFIYKDTLNFSAEIKTYKPGSEIFLRNTSLKYAYQVQGTVQFENQEIGQETLWIGEELEESFKTTTDSIFIEIR